MKKKSNGDGKLAWWQLSLVGVGCIIGTGYFLGSGIAIKMTGPSVLISFLLAALGTYIVYEALAKMSVKDPQKGSFRSYAKKAYGRWAGFSSGWVYWFSEMLITGSQLTALSIFTRFWFPHVPIWIFASIYAVLGVIVVIIGTKGFEKAENIFAITKIAAILMFIILAVLAISGVIDGGKGDFSFPKEFFPKGITGLWSSLIFGFYAFGGIEIMGIMATRLKNKGDAPKAGTFMLIMLTIIYVISLGLAVSMVSWDQFNTEESPFVIALADYDLPFFPHVFNGALIIAGFSTMAASLFAVTTMLVTLAKDGDAPKVFAKQGKIKVPPLALGLTVAGLVTSIVISLLMPDRVYEYITTAAGLMLLYNWFFILITVGKLIRITAFGQIKRVVGMILIFLAVSGTLLDKASRPGLFVSLVFVGLIGIVMLFLRRKWKDDEQPKTRNTYKLL